MPLINKVMFFFHTFLLHPPTVHQTINPPFFFQLYSGFYFPVIHFNTHCLELNLFSQASHILFSHFSLFQHELHHLVALDLVPLLQLLGYMVAQLAEVHCYKLEGRGFDS